MRILPFLLLLIIGTSAVAEEPPNVSCYNEGDAAELTYTFQRSKPSFDARFKHFAQRGDCWEGERWVGISTTYSLKPLF